MNIKERQAELVKFQARKEFVKGLVKMLDIGTDDKGSLVFTNEICDELKEESFYEMLEQYDANVRSELAQ